MIFSVFDFLFYFDITYIFLKALIVLLIFGMARKFEDLI